MPRSRSRERGARANGTQSAPQGRAALGEPEALVLETHTSISAIEQEWKTLEGPADSPALSFEWLAALEATKCASPQRGWAPHHLTLKRASGELLAAAPCYLKGGSEGEFVFDFAWANAARKFGVDYYPKLLVAVPFTPASGSRILTPKGVDRDLAVRALAASLAELAEANELSSAHVLFALEDEAEALAEAGMLQRYGLQYHWHNAGYSTFEDFLASLPSKRRTQIRRERKALAEQKIRIETVPGSNANAALIDAMYGFYVSTVDKFFWGRRYLNRAFFDEVFSTMGDALEVVVARDEHGKAIAGALNLRGRGALYGRYWGTNVDVPFLHFNVCYYHSVDECIRRGIRTFEPGAGGEHKAARGFDPTVTRSLHIIRDPKFRAAIADFVEREREVVLKEAREG
jgi:uncharacterized protein